MLSVLLLLGLLLTASHLACAQIVSWGSSATNIPVSVQAADIVAVSAGSLANLALDSTGKVYHWCSTEELPVPPQATSVVAIASSPSHFLALRSDGMVLAWGYNSYGQTNVPLEALTGVSAIAAGLYHSLALKQDGTVVAWGQNDAGQAQVPAGLSNVVRISGGYSHSLALRADGTVVGWGTSFGNTYTQPPDLTNLVAIAAGAGFSVAVRATGEVVQWGTGFPFIPFTAPPADLTNVVTVAASKKADEPFALALTADGRVRGWGTAHSGELDIPPGLSEIAAISVSFDTCLALQGPVIMAPPKASPPYPLPGDTVVLSVEVLATETVAYQWIFQGTNLPNATNATLTLTNIGTAQVGNYSVRVTGRKATRISQPAELNVGVAPFFFTHPLAAQTISFGDPLTLTATAGGSSLTYQWRSNFTDIPGATNSTLSITSLKSPPVVRSPFGPFGLIPEPHEAINLFSLVASNSYGCVESRVANVATRVPPDAVRGVRFSARNYLCDENFGQVAIRLERSLTDATNVTVRFRSIPDSAFAGLHFAPTNFLVSLTTGETNKVIKVPVVNDSLAERDRRFFVSLEDPDGIAPAAYATATIYDDDTDAGLKSPRLNYFANRETASPGKSFLNLFVENISTVLAPPARLIVMRQSARLSNSSFVRTDIQTDIILNTNIPALQPQGSRLQFSFNPDVYEPPFGFSSTDRNDHKIYVVLIEEAPFVNPSYHSSMIFDNIGGAVSGGGVPVGADSFNGASGFGSTLLVGLFIDGPTLVRDPSNVVYSARATFGDGSTQVVDPLWNSVFFSIPFDGIATFPNSPGEASSTVTATYSVGGIQRTVSKTVTNLPLPRLGGVLQPPDGQFKFQLTGRSGVNFDLEASTNLVNWVRLNTLTNAANTNNLSLDVGVANRFQFFRARELP